MPTILRELGFRFFFYTREPNEPPHIHIIGRSGEAKVWLNDLSFQKVYNLKPKDQKDILQIVLKNRKMFLKEWRKYHG